MPAPSPRFHALVATTTAKDHQEMIGAARPFFEKMTAENGFSLEFTDDRNRINGDVLAGCQVFIHLHLAPFEMTPLQQEALQRFIEGGGGWVGIHAAALTGKQFVRADRPYWQWYEDFLGGVTYSPHPAYQTGTAVVEDRTHPATRNLPATLILADEWYEFDGNPRDNGVRVLVTADESTYSPKKPMGDHPIVWVNEAYRRAIYIGLGHDSAALANPGYATLLRDAVLWAAM